jgi:hypothetical protein
VENYWRVGHRNEAKFKSICNAFLKKQGRWRIYLPRSNEFIVTDHASFVDHRLGTEFKSTKGIITCNEEDNYLRVEKYPVEAVVTSNVGSPIKISYKSQLPTVKG